MSEREQIKQLGGPNWAKKVDQMTDEQVIAIYLSAKRRGRL